MFVPAFLPLGDTFAKVNRAFPTNIELVIQRLGQVLSDTDKDAQWEGLEGQEQGLGGQGFRSLIQV